MKEKIVTRISELRELLNEQGEDYSDSDYIEGAIDAYEIVLQMMEEEK